MPPKHPRRNSSTDPSPPAKRHQPSLHHTPAAPTRPDLLTPLSDELLLRILTFLTPPQLLHALAPVSRRFHRLSQDAQLWKALYYARFVLPRALRIPGPARARGGRKLHYKGRRTLWADGRLGGLVREEEIGDALPLGRTALGRNGLADRDRAVNWLRQFKIRHNWARGKCAVEELKLRPDPDSRQHTPCGDDEECGTKMLVKVVEGLAVTADATFGLRAWDLKTREVVAQIDLRDARDQEAQAAPSCMAIDDRGLDKGNLDIAIGFTDGGFGVWTLGGEEKKSLVRRYRHEKSSNGELVGIAYSHPFLLTATGAVLVSLYTFDVPGKPEIGGVDYDSDSDIEEIPPLFRTADPGPKDRSSKSMQRDAASLPAPYLMTSLKSHTSDPPLALSIRNTGKTTVASIAYTFFTRSGWSIGIQDLHITPNRNPTRTPAITTRLAYTTPVPTTTPRVPTPSSSPPPPTTRSRLASPPPSSPAPPSHRIAPRGPTTLSYTHPYLLATLPDNTLILHLCTSTTAALSISPGIRLWGHTSGISDAEITARGKAVSVSSRGDEMRVWELEGRPSGLRSRSVEIRPGGGVRDEGDVAAAAAAGVIGAVGDWEARRNWVGFDDEMVIVLKEARGGRESLLVYDFT